MGWQQLKGAVAESAPTRSDKLAHVEAERMRTVLSVVMERMREEKNIEYISLTPQFFLLIWFQCRTHLFKS